MENQPERIFTGDQIGSLVNQLQEADKEWERRLEFYGYGGVVASEEDRMVIGSAIELLTRLQNIGRDRLVRLPLPSGEEIALRLPPLVGPITLSPDESERINQLG